MMEQKGSIICCGSLIFSRCHNDQNHHEPPDISLGGGVIFLNSDPYLRGWSNLTNIFELGWNHQIFQDFEMSPMAEDQELHELAVLQAQVDSSSLRMLRGRLPWEVGSW